MGFNPTTAARPAFGRREPHREVEPQPVAPAPMARVAEHVAAMPTAPAMIAAETPQELTVEQELQAWKDARGSQFKVPWRQVYLMASLCFGVASFVLPDSVNDDVDYLLWALCAMSAYAWFNGRKKKVEAEHVAGA